VLLGKADDRILQGLPGIAEICTEAEISNRHHMASYDSTT
jgi:hypothetical protein